ncbi:hypothetical protein [Nocardia yamanashiensis]|uniref:hypothetical protein n=1 Tax=Nocardia yamanashiensis TaxID=209247 RepID=UPI0012FD3283|nr:hypothetical protein [Nocardia yamanashiensis]
MRTAFGGNAFRSLWTVLCQAGEVEPAGTNESDAPQVIGSAVSEPGWRTGNPIRVAVVALLPMAFVAGTVIAEKVVDQPTTRVGKILAMSNFLGLSTLCVLGPLAVVALVGAIALQNNDIRRGSWFARVAGGAAVIVCVLVVVAVLSDAFGSGSRPYEWHPMYSPPAALLAVTPQLVIAIANIYVLVRLSKRERPDG